ncbi:hypothetical protein DPMN_151489 [Dreissena polymorpha]|uniref:Uncharacterized protein n=1 Tax=Dreissena polymorpha TaxID=45954 RepID=A0A9D4J6J0_DREPO|nr:hypothetical protein DPMN_151489 [Dreissena polymorpha]
MIEENTDPMSASMAATHFSEAVEIEMRKCDFTDLLRSRLLSHVNFGKFPPPTMHVAGWPWQLWGALISHIDAKTQLYFLCHGGSYNARAFSSLIGETFFSELSFHDKTGCGTVSAERTASSSTRPK